MVCTVQHIADLLNKTSKATSGRDSESDDDDLDDDNMVCKAVFASFVFESCC